MLKEGLDSRIAREAGSALGTLGFYSHVLTRHLSQLGQEALLRMNPFSATTAQMMERHPSWTGVSLREILRAQQVSEDRLNFVELATGKDLGTIYAVGEAKAIPGTPGGIVSGRFAGKGDHSVYVEVDGTEDIGTARYYIGLKGLQPGGKSYTWEEINPSL